MSGLMAIFWKELADHFNSKRFIILSLLIYLAGIATIYVAAQNIRTGLTETTEFIFLRLFIVSGETLPFSLPFFLSLFIPIVGIALGFDAVNSERASGNLSRLLSQPLYRDSVINGKFLAGLITLAILVTSIVLLVAGANGEIAGAISRISPGVLYGEVTQVLLIPSHPTMFMISMYYTGLEPNPLPLSQSLLIAWPQLTSLIGLTALCFAISYIKFMREEIRSTCSVASL